MKKFACISFIVLMAAQVQAHPHLDLEMSSREYKAYYHSQQKKQLENLKSQEMQKQAAIKKQLQLNQKNKIENPTTPDPEEADLQKWIGIGEKNMQWVDLVNQSRPAGQKISLSSQATQGGISVLNPKTYSYKTIKENWQVLQTLIPGPLRDVIFGGAPITANIPVSDREFTEWLFQVDHAYQDSSRYEMNRKWKDEYAQEAQDDVRGYLYLRDLDGLDAKLKSWKDLSLAQKERLTTSLVQICQNTGEANCEKSFAAAQAKGQFLEFKNRYLDAAAKHYQAYFQIPQARADITWNSKQPGVLEIPFANPHNDQVMQFLQNNIQNEWKWNSWQLHLNFVESDDPDTTHVTFEAGATPHVNAVAGSIITMDQNALLSEYDVQWTIRHEYGHVLGFRDCYLEFYDESIEAFVSYQLDVTNLMCSRRGHFQQTHFDELKRVYFKN